MADYRSQNPTTSAPETRDDAPPTDAFGMVVRPINNTNSTTFTGLVFVVPTYVQWKIIASQPASPADRPTYYATVTGGIDAAISKGPIVFLVHITAAADLADFGAFFIGSSGTINVPETGDAIARAASIDQVGGSTPPSIQRRFDIGTSAIYVGYSVRGAPGSDSIWSIQRITLVSGNPTQGQWAPENSSWDNRAILTYT